VTLITPPAQIICNLQVTPQANKSLLLYNQTLLCDLYTSNKGISFDYKQVSRGVLLYRRSLIVHEQEEFDYVVPFEVFLLWEIVLPTKLLYDHMILLSHLFCKDTGLQH
jgi:hypothetical protein